MLNIKKTPAPATLGKGVSAGANERTWSQTTSTFAEMEDFAAVNFLGLTPGEDSGRITPELQNSSEKARRSLDTGIFYCVYAPEKHSESTAILAGSGLIKHPSGEYARRSQTLLSSRPFLHSLNKWQPVELQKI